MAHSYSADSDASVEEVWPLISQPERWSDWAPHVRGAWGLGTPEVEAGRRGAVRLIGIVPVPAVVSAKTPGRSWTWRVGPMTLDHAVEPTARGSRITMTMSAPGPLETVLAATYGPIVQFLVRRLARIAERD
ncbi:MAG: SRPBCC family protein [Nocardiaceae bacterium]|nr:SRPBCC family protein [Nocardiaceae bacterium]